MNGRYSTNFKVVTTRYLEVIFLSLKFVGFPKIIYRGVYDEKNYLAMQLLGESLQSLTLKMGRLLSLKTIL